MQTSVQYTFHDQGQEREGEVAQVRLQVIKLNFFTMNERTMQPLFTDSLRCTAHLLHVLQLLRLLQLLHGSSKLRYPLTGVTIVDNACNGEVADKYSH